MTHSGRIMFPARIILLTRTGRLLCFALCAVWIGRGGIADPDGSGVGFVLWSGQRTKFCTTIPQFSDNLGQCRDGHRVSIVEQDDQPGGSFYGTTRC